MSKSYRLVYYKSDLNSDPIPYKVYEQYIGDDDNYFVANTMGIGKTKEEALEDYKENFRKALRELNDFVSEIFLGNVPLQLTEVDFFGQEVEQHES